MRIVAFFSAIAVIILLLAGCGHEKSNNSQVVNLVQLEWSIRKYRSRISFS